MLFGWGKAHALGTSFLGFRWICFSLGNKGYIIATARRRSLRFRSPSFSQTIATELTPSPMATRLHHSSPLSFLHSQARRHFEKKVWFDALRFTLCMFLILTNPDYLCFRCLHEVWEEGVEKYYLCRSLLGEEGRRIWRRLGRLKEKKREALWASLLCWKIWYLYLLF